MIILQQNCFFSSDIECCVTHTCACTHTHTHTHTHTILFTLNLLFWKGPVDDTKRMCIGKETTTIKKNMVAKSAVTKYNTTIIKKICLPVHNVHHERLSKHYIHI